MERKSNIVAEPSFKVALCVFCVWFVGLTLSIMAMSDLFTQNPVKHGSYFIWLNCVGATVACAIVLRNYFLVTERKT